MPASDVISALPEKYAVSDTTGAYVLFSNDLREARLHARSVTESAKQDGIPGCAAILRWNPDTDSYEVFMEWCDD